MASGIPTKKLLKTALYTSVLIGGALTIAPHAMMRSVSKTDFIANTALYAFMHIVFLLFLWSANIVLVYFVEKHDWGKFSTAVRYTLSYFICTVLILNARFFLLPLIYNDKSSEHFLTIFMILGLALNTIVLIIQDLVLLREKKTNVEIENARLKIKNVEAMNQQLKQQIQPHFLFNSLSTLKTLVRKKPVQAEEYLMMLSDFLRASVSADTADTVRLKDEIKLCIDYLEMQKMRFDGALMYVINIHEEIQNSAFVPNFSLLPLLENAIKHNVLTNELPLHIKMNYERDRIVITNNVRLKRLSGPSTGFGLENLAERYKLLSGDEVIVSSDKNFFSVSIKTLEDESGNYRR